MRKFTSTCAWNTIITWDDIVEDGGGGQNFTFYSATYLDLPDCRSTTNVDSPSGEFRIRWSRDLSDKWIDVILDNTYTLTKEKVRLSIAHILGIPEAETTLE